MQVDMYGGEISRDLQPTQEYGSFYWDLFASCMRVYALAQGRMAFEYLLLFESAQPVLCQIAVSPTSLAVLPTQQQRTIMSGRFPSTQGIFYRIVYSPSLNCDLTQGRQLANRFGE